MAFSVSILINLVALVLLAGAGKSLSSTNQVSPFKFCTGSAKYNVTFINMLTSDRFGSLIPSNGLGYSPLTATGHSNRVSILTVRGYASEEVEAIAETSNNARLLSMLKTLQKAGQGVKGFAAASDPTMPGSSTSVVVNVDCKHPFITGLAMIGPSPDWFVQISNVNMYSRRSRRFLSIRYGHLIAYDAGTDDGREFTPADPTLDIPTVPQRNIAPLVEDDTDRFRGRIVGKYLIKKVRN